MLSRLDPATNRWALVRWHNGVIDALPVDQRAVAFDADAMGNPVVVYSRCAHAPPAVGSGLVVTRGRAAGRMSFSVARAPEPQG